VGQQGKGVVNKQVTEHTLPFLTKIVVLLLPVLRKKLEEVFEGVKHIQSPNIPIWHTDNFELKGIEN
jgi:hypothetical protein